MWFRDLQQRHLLLQFLVPVNHLLPSALKTVFSNGSTRICAPVGGACTQQICQRDEPDPEPEPEGEKCGSVICGSGTECCNSSCSCEGPSLAL